VPVSTVAEDVTIYLLLILLIFLQQALELSNGSLMTVSGERCDGSSAPPHHSPTPSPRPGPPSRTGPPAAPLEDQPVGGAGRTFAQLMSEKVVRVFNFSVVDPDPVGFRMQLLSVLR
jgi:hypothetical protein